MRLRVVVPLLLAGGVAVAMFARWDAPSRSGASEGSPSPAAHRVAPAAAPPRQRSTSRPAPVSPKAAATCRIVPPEPTEERVMLDSLPEAVIVRHYDGTTGVYAPEDWPDDGDGEIVARKLPDGEIAWYAGPDAGERSDPDAFVVPDPYVPRPSRRWERMADGTILIGGEVADPAVQAAFGGR